MVFMDAFWRMLVGQNFSQDRAIFNPFLIPSIRYKCPSYSLDLFYFEQYIEFVQIETPRLVSR